MGKSYSISKQTNYLLEEQQAMYILQHSLKGVAASSVDNIIKISGYERQRMEIILDTTYKTYSRYKKEKKLLNASQSEKILKLEQLFIFGTEVFGSKEALNLWMKSPSIALGQIVPDEAIKTSTGIDLVLTEITNIAYGNTA